MALVTKESVYAACHAISERGGKISWNSVRDELGGRGSPNDGLPHLKAWRADLAASLATTAAALPETPVVGGEPLSAPSVPEVSEAVAALVQAVAVATTRIKVEERRSGEARLNVLASSHAEGQAAHDRLHTEAVAALALRLSDSEADLDEATLALAEAETMRDRVAELEAEGTALRSELAAGAADLTSVRAALAEAIEGRKVAIAAADHAGSEAREWKAQLGLAQGEVATTRDAAAAAAMVASKALDAARAELTAALAAARSDAAAAAKAASEALDATRKELSAAEAVARAAAAAAVKETSTALDSARREVTEAGGAARLVEQRLADAQAAEVRERTARERAEERAAGLIERASRAEVELSILRPAPAAAA